MRSEGFEPTTLGFEGRLRSSDGLVPAVTPSHPRDNAEGEAKAASLPLAPIGLPTTPHGPPVVRGLVRPVGQLRAVQGGADRLLTVRDVAERLAVSTATVYALVERGELAHVRVSNAIRIARSDLITYLERNGGDDAEAAGKSPVPGS